VVFSVMVKYRKSLHRSNRELPGTNGFDLIQVSDTSTTRANSRRSKQYLPLTYR